MPKRFTSTEIWDEDWFLDIPPEYMLLWFYIKDKCNHAGIWRANLRFFNSLFKKKVNLEKALEYFNNEKDRIKVIDHKKWFIIDFFYFQYGSTLNLNNSVHRSIYEIYKELNINIKSIRGLREVKESSKRGQEEVKKGVKDIDKDKEEDKKNSKGLKIKESLEYYTQEYTENKGHEKINGYVNIVRFIKKENDLKEPLDSVLSVERQLSYKQYLTLLDYGDVRQIKDAIFGLYNGDYLKKKKTLVGTIRNWLKNNG